VEDASQNEIIAQARDTRKKNYFCFILIIYKN